MFEVIATHQFRKQYKLCLKRKLDISLLDDLIITLSDKGVVPPTHQPHILSGSYSGFWECHIKSDWLLIWKNDVEIRTITLIGTGTHSDLF